MKRAGGWILITCLVVTTQAQAKRHDRPPSQQSAPSPTPPEAASPGPDSAPPAGQDPERPWAAGVGPEQQSKALDLYKEGNALFEESKHAEASARYKEALAIWDHPAIRYNLAVALFLLTQPLAAYQNLLLGLKFGAAPLGAEVYKQGLTYKKILEDQLAQLKVSCKEPKAQVSLDGEPLFVAPGETKRLMVPGRHQLVATKPGHLTETRALVLLPGELTSEALKLSPLKALATKRRWAVWKPPVVLAAGVVVAAIGIPLILQARSDFASYDTEIANNCLTGCLPGELSAPVRDLESRGTAEYGSSLAMFSVGGAVAVAGLVMVIVNAPRVVESNKPSRVSFAPVLGPKLAAGSISVRF